MNTWKKIRTENRKKWKHNEQTGFLHVSISDEKMKACLTQAPQTQTSRRVRRRPVVAAICTLGLVLAMVCTPLGSYATQFLFQPVSTQKPTEQIHPHYGFQQEAPLTCLSEKTLRWSYHARLSVQGFSRATDRGPQSDGCFCPDSGQNGRDVFYSRAMRDTGTVLSGCRRCNRFYQRCFVTLYITNRCFRCHCARRLSLSAFADSTPITSYKKEGNFPSFLCMFIFG